MGALGLQNDVEYILYILLFRYFLRRIGGEGCHTGQDLVAWFPIKRMEEKNIKIG